MSPTATAKQVPPTRMPLPESDPEDTEGGQPQVPACLIDGAVKHLPRRTGADGADARQRPSVG